MFRQRNKTLPDSRLSDERVFARIARRAAIWLAGAAAAFLPGLFDLKPSDNVSGPWLSFISSVLFLTAAGYLDVVVLRRKGLNGIGRKLVSAFTGGFVCLSFVAVIIAANYTSTAVGGKVSKDFGVACAVFILFAGVGEIWLASQDKQ